jgi:hypothetical protein
MSESRQSDPDACGILRAAVVDDAPRRVTLSVVVQERTSRQVAIPDVPCVISRDAKDFIDEKPVYKPELCRWERSGRLGFDVGVRLPVLGGVSAQVLVSVPATGTNPFIPPSTSHDIVNAGALRLRAL